VNDTGFFGVSAAPCVLTHYCYKKTNSDGVSQVGSRLSLSDVALDGIEDSRLGSALTRVSEAQRGRMVPSPFGSQVPEFRQLQVHYTDREVLCSM
jgi:hypothetical protein